jgi:regulatory protein
MSYGFKKPSKTNEPENAKKAYEYAIFLLSLKLRTVGEVLLKMKNRGYGEEIILKVIEQLKEQKYLNDENYAEVYLVNLKTYKNFGYFGIKKKLMEKKIPNELIEKVLSEGLSEAEEIKIAKRFLAKLGVKVKQSETENSYSTFDEEESKEKQKLANKLKSRGFRGSVVSRLVF